MQTQLPQLLAVQHDPLVEPLRKEVASGTERLQRGAVAQACVVEHPAGQLKNLARIDGDGGVQPDQVAGLLQQGRRVDASQAGESRAERRPSLIRVRIGPQGDRSHRSANPAVAQRQKGGQALRAAVELEPARFPGHREFPQQSHPQPGCPTVRHRPAHRPFPPESPRRLPYNRPTLSNKYQKTAELVN